MCTFCGKSLFWLDGKRWPNGHFCPFYLNICDWASTFIYRKNQRTLLTLTNALLILSHSSSLYVTTTIAPPPARKKTIHRGSLFFLMVCLLRASAESVKNSTPSSVWLRNPQFHFPGGRGRVGSSWIVLDAPVVVSVIISTLRQSLNRFRSLTPWRQFWVPKGLETCTWQCEMNAIYLRSTGMSSHGHWAMCDDISRMQFI